MGGISGILFFVLAGLGGLLFIGGIIYLVAYFTKDGGKKINFNINTLLHIYFYVISLVSLAISIIGLVIFMNALMSYKFGVPFSYELSEVNSPIEIGGGMTEPLCYQGNPMDIEGQKVCFDSERQKSDIVNGLSFFVSMIIIYILHRIGLHIVEKKEKFVWLKKIYNFLSLIGYSLVGIISIPMATYLLVNYIYFRPDNIVQINPPSIPVAISVITIPIWITFFIKTLKNQENIKNK